MRRGLTNELLHGQGRLLIGGGGTTGPEQAPPKPAIPGGYPPAASGDWSLIQGMVGGGNGRGGLFGPGAMQLLCDVGSSEPPYQGEPSITNSDGMTSKSPSRVGYCCGRCRLKDTKGNSSCTADACCKIEEAVNHASLAFEQLNRELLGWSLWGAILSTVALFLGPYGPAISISISIVFSIIEASKYEAGVTNQWESIATSVKNSGCWYCIDDCMKRELGVGYSDEILEYLGWAALGYAPSILKGVPFLRNLKVIQAIQGKTGNGVFGGASGWFGFNGHTNPWEDWLLPVYPIRAY